jgi:prolyl oligopeptidase
MIGDNRDDSADSRYFGSIPRHLLTGRAETSRLTTGMTDPRVDPWSPAKMAARLQKANASKNPVLLRVTIDAGHGFGSTRTQIDEERADEYAFVLWRAGHHAFQPKST